MDDRHNQSEENHSRKNPGELNAFERFYEHFRGIPLKYIDRFIIICVVALILVVAIGILKAQ